MDFSFTPEQEALRKEFMDFFEEVMTEAPPGWSGGLEDMYDSDAGAAFHRGVAQKLAQKGWLVRAWPKEYGGQDAPMVEQMIFSDANGYCGAPGIDVFGVGMIGPTLLAVGSEEQRKEHIPKIASGECMWCQLWSEPNAGSDLAALATTAIRDGDDYVINGQKIWTSGAHRADWGFGIFRTDPNLKRSKGLSFILVDMKAPGIEVKPLYSMGRAHMFNEVFFDNVRVPVKNRVGEENQGWAVTRAAMNFERSNVGMMSMAKRFLNKVIDYCKRTKRDGRLLIEDPFVRHKLAQMEIEIDVGWALSYRITWIQHNNQMLEAASLASSAKVWGTEMIQRFSNNILEILGLHGCMTKHEPMAPFNGIFEGLYQLCPGLNILAGTSEIQRNTIAWIALGMPRSWDQIFKKQQA
jgi:alkylation response protein AidB-like acyl-CoA dehydrogenase